MLKMWFTDHTFDVVLSSLTGAPHRMEPDFFTNTQFNSANTAPGASNVGEYSNPEFDRIGNQQIKIYDPEERRPLIFELQRMIVEEQPEAVLHSVVQVFAVNKDNVEFDPLRRKPARDTGEREPDPHAVEARPEPCPDRLDAGIFGVEPDCRPHHRGDRGCGPAL